MGFLMQNMGNDPTSQLYIEIFWDMHRYLGQNRGEWLESLIIYLLPVSTSLCQIRAVSAKQTFRGLVLSVRQDSFLSHRWPLFP